MRCHEVDYNVIGDDLQMVEIGLDPGETVIAEAGAMNFMEANIRFEARLGDGARPDEGLLGSLASAGKRALTGESIFMTHFTNIGARRRHVTFAAPFPGRITAVDLSRFGEELVCQKDSFLAAAHGTQLDIAFMRRLGVGFFGGEGLILQRLRGDGLVFLHSGGTVVERKLEGEPLRVDTGCLVAMTADVDYSIERAGNLKSMFFGGEGMFLATLNGYGTVWLQSLPFSRLADRVLASAPRAGGRRTGEGSLLGVLARLFER